MIGVLLYMFPVCWAVFVSALFYWADRKRRALAAELVTAMEVSESRRSRAVELAYHLRAAGRRGYALDPFVEGVISRVMAEEEARKLKELAGMAMVAAVLTGPEGNDWGPPPIGRKS